MQACLRLVWHPEGTNTVSVIQQEDMLLNRTSSSNISLVFKGASCKQKRVYSLKQRQSPYGSYGATPVI